MPLCRLLASHEHGTMEKQPASRLATACSSGMSSCSNMHIITMHIIGDYASRTNPQPGFVTAAAAEAAWHSLRRRLPCPNPQHANFELLSSAAPVAGAKGHLAVGCAMARQHMHCMLPDDMLEGCHRCVGSILLAGGLPCSALQQGVTGNMQLASAAVLPGCLRPPCLLQACSPCAAAGT